MCGSCRIGPFSSEELPKECIKRFLQSSAGILTDVELRPKRTYDPLSDKKSPDLRVGLQGRSCKQ